MPSVSNLLKRLFFFILINQFLINTQAMANDPPSATNVFDLITQGAVQLAPGAIAGAGYTPPVHILNMIKVRLQNGHSIDQAIALKGLVRGMPVKMMDNFVNKSVLVVIKNQTENYLRGPDQQELTTLQRIIAAALGGFAASIPNTPAERVIIRAQSTPLLPSGTAVSPFSLASTMVRNEGLRTLGVGFTPTVAREMLFSIGILWAPDVIRTALPESSRDTLWATIFSNTTAALLTGAINHPFDTAKTAMARRPGLEGPGLAGTITQIVRTSGGMALWHGYVPRALILALGGPLFRNIASTCECALNAK